MPKSKQITVNLKGRTESAKDKARKLLKDGWVVTSFTANSMTFTKPLSKKVPKK